MLKVFAICLIRPTTKSTIRIEVKAMSQDSALTQAKDSLPTWVPIAISQIPVFK